MQAPPPAKKPAAGKKKAKEESSSDSSSDEDMETDKIGTAAAALAKVLNVYLHSFNTCTLYNSKDLIYALLIEQLVLLYSTVHVILYSMPSPLNGVLFSKEGTCI